MTMTSLFIFFIRSLLQICVYLIQQLPTDMEIEVEPRLFLHSFSMAGPNGERVTAGDWATAPNGSGSAHWAAESTDFETQTPDPDPEGSNPEPRAPTLREEHIGEWNEHVRRACLFIPSLHNIDVLEKLTAHGQGGKRKASKKSSCKCSSFNLKFHTEIWRYSQ